MKGIVPSHISKLDYPYILERIFSTLKTKTKKFKVFFRQKRKNEKAKISNVAINRQQIFQQFHGVSTLFSRLARV